ncbi:hypothetical protein NUW58_g7653 [Xylaria curta]|uniref:Uncharacterized protein n=1 Tax=Xylaria curta TaxID=42375 RepID=A0ACC1NHW4_9PEZI|nr:hypothetical protein NUW58_g7653 [Xylaria curta]
MANYGRSNWEEESDDSDIEVHPHIDRASFLRMMKREKYIQRQERQLELEALKQEITINNVLMERLSALHSTLKSHAHGAQSDPPTKVALQAIMESALYSSEDDDPPPPIKGWPGEGQGEGQMRPSYSTMITRILDGVNKKLDDRHTQAHERHNAFVEEIGISIQNMQNSQQEVAQRLDELEKKEAIEASRVNKRRPRGTLIFPTHEEISVSRKAKLFADIDIVDYQRSREFISFYPEILEESESYSLLNIAFNMLIEDNDEPRAYQYIHQMMILEWCRDLRRSGQDSAESLWDRLTSPSLEVRESVMKSFYEKFEQVRRLAKSIQRITKKPREVIQLRDVGPSRQMRICVPDAESEDVKVQGARDIFNGFTPEMRAALESGSLDNVNKVLENMEVSEAENMVQLLSESGCIGTKAELVDATTEEGKKRLREIEEAAKSGKVT